MTDRNHKKDLEVINLWFRDEVSKEDSMPEETLTLLFSHIDPLYELHAAFLKDTEQRVATFDSKEMEIISKPRLKNLTHIVIGSYQCMMDNIYGMKPCYGATHSTKADMTVYVYPHKTVQGGCSASLKHSAARERKSHVNPETNTYATMNVKTDDMGVYTCIASNMVVAIITNTINTCFRPG